METMRSATIIYGSIKAELKAHALEGMLGDETPVFDFGSCCLYKGELRSKDQLANLPFALRLYASTDEAKKSLQEVFDRRPALKHGAALSRVGNHHYLVVFPRKGEYQADALAYRLDPEPSSPPVGIPPESLFDDGPTLVGSAAVGEEDAVAEEAVQAEEEGFAVAFSPSASSCGKSQPEDASGSGKVGEDGYASPTSETSPVKGEKEVNETNHHTESQPDRGESESTGGHPTTTASDDCKQQETYRQQDGEHKKPSNWSDLVRSSAPAGQQSQTMLRSTSSGQLARSQQGSRSSGAAGSQQKTQSRVEEVLARTGYAQAMHSGNSASSQRSQSASQQRVDAENSGGDKNHSHKQQQQQQGGGKVKKEVMEVENAKIGQVIGKSGSTVNTIRQETGATIDIQTQPGQQPRDRTTIVVKGPQGKVRAAKEQIDRLLAGQSSNDKPRRHQQQSEQPTNSGNSSSASHQLTKTIDLPSEGVKQLLGPNGRIHKWMQNESNARIVIYDDKQAKLVGTKDAVQEAERLIQGILDKSIEAPHHVVSTSSQEGDGEAVKS